MISPIPVSRLAKSFSAVAVVLGAALFSTHSFGQAQPGQPSQPGQPTQPGQPGQPGQGGDDPAQRFEQFRKTAEDRMKTMLGATDDEFSVLKPRIEKLQQLQMANDGRMVGFGRLMGMGGAGSWRTRPTAPAEGQRPAEGNNNNQGDQARAQRWNPFGNLSENPVYQKAQELGDALESKEANDATLKQKVAELRAARVKAKEEITRAQEELRGLCSVRAEAALVMMGILE